MFTQAKNINSAFRHIKWFSVALIICTLLISLFSLYENHRIIKETQSRIYILANGKALEAYGADRKDNIPVEAKDHIAMFHHYFFTLDPDEKVITGNITRALYLSDGSAKKEYDNLKENGYYGSVISGNISQQVAVDSVYININGYP